MPLSMQISTFFKYMSLPLFYNMRLVFQGIRTNDQESWSCGPDIVSRRWSCFCPQAEEQSNALPANWSSFSLAGLLNEGRAVCLPTRLSIPKGLN